MIGQSEELRLWTTVHGGETPHLYLTFKKSRRPAARQLI